MPVKCFYVRKRVIKSTFSSNDPRYIGTGLRSKARKFNSLSLPWFDLWTVYALHVDSCADLLEQRTGCIICMDYSDYNQDYYRLFIHFKAISKILQAKLAELRDKSFRSADAFLFGFSFGARLITRAASDFGPKQIGSIHRKWISPI